jgi:hypothetical protein
MAMRQTVLRAIAIRPPELDPNRFSYDRSLPSSAVSKSSSGRRRRLTSRAGQFLIDTRPRRCRAGPDRKRRLREFGVIQCSGPEDSQVRSRLRLTRHRRSTALAELPVHAAAAVRHARIVPQRSSHRDGGGRKYKVYGCAPCSKILAVAAPADPGCNRIRGNGVPHRPAKTSTCDRHRSSPRAYYTWSLELYRAGASQTFALWIMPCK